MSLSADPVVTQSINREQGGLYAVVSIKNTSDSSIFLQIVAPSRERVLGQEFLISSDGRSIPFVGALAKRKPLQKSDFYELKSNSEEVRKIRIDLDYEFLAGNHKYDISYIYLVYSLDHNKIEARYSEKVTLEYAR